AEVIPAYIAFVCASSSSTRFMRTMWMPYSSATKMSEVITRPRGGEVSMVRGKIREHAGMPAIIMGDGRLREFQWGGGQNRLRYRFRVGIAHERFCLPRRAHCRRDAHPTH